MRTACWYVAPLMSVITTLYYVAISFQLVRGAPHCITLSVLFIVESGIARFLCAMHVIKVWASSPSPRLPLCQI